MTFTRCSAPTHGSRVTGSAAQFQLRRDPLRARSCRADAVLIGAGTVDRQDRYDDKPLGRLLRLRPAWHAGKEYAFIDPVTGTGLPLCRHLVFLSCSRSGAVFEELSAGAGVTVYRPYDILGCSLGNVSSIGRCENLLIIDEGFDPGGQPVQVERLGQHMHTR